MLVQEAIHSSRTRREKGMVIKKSSGNPSLPQVLAVFCHVGQDKSKDSLVGTQWLNPVSKVVLIKSVLLALPIFQSSPLLAHTNVKLSIPQELRHFLWEGGRSNTKRFHLVNWNIIRAPKANGGLGIKNPVLSNIVVGSKLL